MYAKMKHPCDSPPFTAFGPSPNTKITTGNIKKWENALAVYNTLLITHPLDISEVTLLLEWAAYMLDYEESGRITSADPD